MIDYEQARRSNLTSFGLDRKVVQGMTVKRAAGAVDLDDAG